MQITEAEMGTNGEYPIGSTDASAPSALAQVRRIEAVSFRAFPSTVLEYDRTWAIRMTAAHPAKRINSVNVLDPLDRTDLEKRIEIAKVRFDSYGKPLIFRQTPLMPAELADILDRQGWVYRERSLVLAAPLEPPMFADSFDTLPLQDRGRWVDHYLALSGESGDRKAGMVEVISAIPARCGLFLRETERNDPLCVLRCVCDSELAGLFELETRRDTRRQGHASALLASALKWAFAQGARRAWLQVTADNEPALALYGKFGFQPIYSYVYRVRPE